MDGAIRVAIVTTNEQLMHAYAVRSICFMEESGLPARRTFDGNDFQATHVVVYADDEPIGAARIRWFNGFAKIERTALRKAWRNPRVLRQVAEFIFEHAAHKGYGKVITLAKPQYASVWIRLLGFRQIVGRPPSLSGEGDPFVQLVRDLPVDPDAISIDTDPKVLFRTEGSWNVPSAFETPRRLALGVGATGTLRRRVGQR